MNSFTNMRIVMSNIFKPNINKTLHKGITSSIIVNNKTFPKSTVDAADVEKHSQLGKDWWNPNGSLIGLHRFNLVRVPFIRDGLVSCSLEDRTILPLSKKTILDVGCGGGILSEALARIGAKVTGIDASNELIELATEHSQIDSKISENKPLYRCETIEEHSKQFTDHYDAVVASEVIEHVADKELFIKACVQSVKPGGKIFITTPNKSRLTQILGIWLAEYVINAVPKGTHEYEKFTTPNEVTFLLERNNCHVQLIHGLMYNPINNKWSWVNSHTLLFALQAVKLENDQ
ncbi:unnamed protein product, partial [Brenthis ino]